MPQRYPRITAAASEDYRRDFFAFFVVFLAAFFAFFFAAINLFLSGVSR